jgi:hypothetical protein
LPLFALKPLDFRTKFLSCENASHLSNEVGQGELAPQGPNDWPLEPRAMSAVGEGSGYRRLALASLPPEKAQPYVSKLGCITMENSDGLRRA